MTLESVGKKPACFQSVTPPTYTIDRDFFDRPTDVRVHNAYQVSWRPSDTATLTPQPPAITCGLTDSWVPGSPATSSPCPVYKSDSYIPGTALAFLAIGLPIIFVFVVIGCVSTCCYYSRKNRHERRERARAAMEQNAAVEQNAAREQDDTSHDGAPAPQHRT